MAKALYPLAYLLDHSRSLGTEAESVLNFNWPVTSSNHYFRPVEAGGPNVNEHFSILDFEVLDFLDFKNFWPA